jgi:hypothetical protein
VNLKPGDLALEKRKYNIVDRVDLFNAEKLSYYSFPIVISGSLDSYSFNPRIYLSDYYNVCIFTEQSRSSVSNAFFRTTPFSRLLLTAVP